MCTAELKPLMTPLLLMHGWDASIAVADALVLPSLSPLPLSPFSCCLSVFNFPLYTTSFSMKQDRFPVFHFSFIYFKQDFYLFIYFWINLQY